MASLNYTDPVYKNLPKTCQCSIVTECRKHWKFPRPVRFSHHVAQRALNLGSSLLNLPSAGITSVH